MLASERSKMTPRERVRLALDHKEPDRVPLDLGSTGNTGITAIAYRKLLSYLGIEAEVVVWDRMQQLAMPDERVLLRLGVDTRGLWLGGPEKRPDRFLDGDSYEDEWGVVRSRPPGGFYYDLVRSPLAGDIIEGDVRSFPWPDPEDPGRFQGVREKARQIHEQNHFAVVVHAAAGFITRSQYLRGFEDWFMDVVAQPDLVGMILDHTLEWQMAIVARMLREVGQYADVVMLGDDVGAQGGPLVSPAVYRKVLKPRQARLFALVHEMTSAKLLYHTCGSVIDLLDDLIEIGVDVLNPVQVASARMDTVELKRRFGDRLSFWGGIDTQRVMPLGTTEEVRSEVRKRVADLAPSGGYVVDTVHNIQADVPPENIVAMYEEAARVGQYPLRVPVEA